MNSAGSALISFACSMSALVSLYIGFSIWSMPSPKIPDDADIPTAIRIYRRQLLKCVGLAVIAVVFTLPVFLAAYL